MDTRFRSGTVSQSGMRIHRNDYGHYKLYYPVLGIVQNVYFSDEPLNVSATHRQNQRGPHAEATVVVINDGSDAPWILKNVVILPPSNTGSDDYSEELPNSTTGTIDGTELTFRTPPCNMNGDICVVQFIGGSISQPCITAWWPHPTNIRDPITLGLKEGSLQQRRRIAKRFQGTRVVVTSKGTVFLDTTEANRPLKQLKPGERRTRDPNPVGGDIRVNIKPECEMSFDWNLPVFDEEEPDFLWSPEELLDKSKTRKTDSSKVRFTKEEIKLIAGSLFEILVNRGNFTISTPEGMQKFGKDADEPMVLGTRWKETMQKMIDDAILKIKVPTAWGPSGAAEDFPANPVNFNTIKNRLPDDTSDFIFGKKVAG